MNRAVPTTMAQSWPHIKAIQGFIHLVRRQNVPRNCDVVVITTAQLHSSKPELMFCVGSNPAHGVSEIRDDEDL